MCRRRHSCSRLVRVTSSTLSWKWEGRAALAGAVVTQVAGWMVPVVAHYLRWGGSEAWDVLGTDFESHFVMMAATTGFGVLHSGLASLRPWVAPRIGERGFRILFALFSLPSAVGTIAYFITHRYDGMTLWQLHTVPGMHDLIVIGTTISFLLLYPATFNLLEVAAIKKPTFRIYEEGIMRITRHPQLWGQVLWCITHTLWIGSTLTLTASLGLISHHFFGAWNGDRRLRDRYGEEWEKFASRTSLIPFQAILEGRQKLEPLEFFRPAYLGVLGFVYLAYISHPAILGLVGYHGQFGG